MLLESKTAIVHGGAGAIGSAVARAYAREGAVVHLTGRTEPALAIVAQRIRSDGGAAHVAQLDVLDRQAVERHASAVAQTSGGVDVCFNATSNDDVQGTPVLDMQLDDFMRPVAKAVSAHFVIATAAARHMVPRRSGVILVMAGGREAIPDLGASHVAWAALAGVCRQLASELGPHGIRVAWLLSPGSPASEEGDAPHGDTAQGRHERADVDTDGSLLRRRPSYDDVANVAVFAASDWARTMTATEVNFTAGVVVD
jgi:3-oxoacyl-[acyl-carrier protein] reductase